MDGLLPRRLLRPVVLAHHGVDRLDPTDDPHALVAAPEHIESQIRLLRRLGYSFATAETLLGDPSERPLPGTALLTFDDGLEDNVRVAAPLLERLGTPATFYVCPGWWGGEHPLARRPLVDEDGARRLVEAGMELGSHTMTHPDLRSVDDSTLRRELVDSKAAVESVSGRPCRTLAYPFGLHDERVRRAAAAAGYELAWAWWPGPWNPLGAPRLPGPPRHGGGRVALKLFGLRRRGMRPGGPARPPADPPGRRGAAPTPASAVPHLKEMPASNDEPHNER